MSACRGSRRSSTPGAQTSSLHAYEHQGLQRDGADWVRFRVRPWQESDEDEVDRRVSGARPAPGAQLLGPRAGPDRGAPCAWSCVGREVTAEVTLSNRDQMGFRMLIGREALRHGASSWIRPLVPGRPSPSSRPASQSRRTRKAALIDLRRPTPGRPRRSCDSGSRAARANSSYDMSSIAATRGGTVSA